MSCNCSRLGGSPYNLHGAQCIINVAEDTRDECHQEIFEFQPCRDGSDRLLQLANLPESLRHSRRHPSPGRFGRRTYYNCHHSHSHKDSAVHPNSHPYSCYIDHIHLADKYHPSHKSSVEV